MHDGWAPLPSNMITSISFEVSTRKTDFMEITRFRDTDLAGTKYRTG